MNNLSAKERGTIFLLNTCSNIKGTTKSCALRNLLQVDYDKDNGNGETSTLYENMSIINIILRLMDNRDFNAVSNEVKKEMIYSDYYPEQAKVLTAVYMDDRRNLCQELHNKMCKVLNIPKTKLIFTSFKQEEMDSSLFSYYDYNNGEILLNTDINYSDCEPTELAQRVIHATYEHEVYNNIKTNLLSLDKLGKKERYLVVSTLMKMFVTDNLLEGGENALANSFSNEDGCSPVCIYAVYNSYEYLYNLFNKNNLNKLNILETFYESRLEFLEDLLGTEDEPYEIEACFDDCGEIEDCEDIDIKYAIIGDTMDYDMNLLYEVEHSEKNKDTKGFFYEFFKEELNDNADSFYGFFGLDMAKDEFVSEYEEFRDEYDHALEDDEENMF